LRRLENLAKGSAFAYEMTLDRHRYGALIVLDRWATLLRAFAPHLDASRRPALLESAFLRIEAAEKVLIAANHLLDASDAYTASALEGCSTAWQSVLGMFSTERTEAEQSASLGPMLPEEYTSARRIFLEDLAER